MKPTQHRVRIIGIILTIVGGIAWTNSIASFVISSKLILNAEMVLLFAGIAVLRPNTCKSAHVLSIIFLAGIVVLLIPITAFTISPHVSVSLFGEHYLPDSALGIAIIMAITSAYIGTLAWIFALLKKDLTYDSSSDT